MDLITQWKAARRVSTPLVAISTPDPAATLQAIAGNGATAPPLVTWDAVRGLRAGNEPGEQALQQAGNLDPAITANPVEALIAAQQLPSKTILAALGLGRYLEQGPVAQAVWLLRDAYKANQRTLVMLGPGFTLPAELAQDVLMLDEQLPNAEQLAGIVRRIHSDAGLEAPQPETETRAVDALAGLAAFSAEQATAMSLRKDGLDLSALWERKRRMIEATPGLSVWRGGENFEGVGGCENVKGFLRRVLTGAEPPAAVVFIDEIEKALSGASGAQGDTSGVSQSMLGTLLTWMQDRRAAGCIFIGPPGSAKSMVAKATGNAAGIPTIAFDLSGMKASLVGESEARLRQALKIVDAVAQGRTLFVATCNSIAVLPPELRRRFGFGTFFFDLPNGEERRAIWSIYLTQYALDEMRCVPPPPDEGWTGAEIRQCCDLAYRLKCSLMDAAAYIVPVARSAAQQIQKLREEASGRYISAGYAGLYRYEQTATSSPTGGRTIALEG